MHLRLSLLIAAASAITTVAAQSNPKLVAGTTGGWIVSQDIVSCRLVRCVPPFTQPVGPCAGGTAYDTRRRGTWVTDGVNIALSDSPVRNFCQWICPPQPLPTPFGPNQYATGLAYDHGRDALFVTDNLNQITIIQIMITPAGCALRALTPCQVTPPPPAGLMLTGIAHCDRDAPNLDLVYYTLADCTSTTASGGLIYVAPASAPCAWFCSLPIRACVNGAVLGPLVGCAYDACTGEVWVTDSLLSAASTVDPFNCSITGTRCCNNAFAAQPWTGLCIEPSLEAYAGIASCTTTSCASCSPTISLQSEPVMGNLGFRVLADNLPAGAMGAILLGFGPCSAGVPSPLCGPIGVALAPPPLAFGGPTGGVGLCDGTRGLVISLPASPIHCGRTLSVQAIGICTAAAPAGTFVSDCVSFTIGSS